MSWLRARFSDSPGIIAEVPPPEENKDIYSQTFEGEGVKAAYETQVNHYIEDWRNKHLFY